MLDAQCRRRCKCVAARLMRKKSRMFALIPWGGKWSVGQPPAVAPRTIRNVCPSCACVMSESVCKQMREGLRSSKPCAVEGSGCPGILLPNRMLFRSCQLERRRDSMPCTSGSSVALMPDVQRGAVAAASPLPRSSTREPAGTEAVSLGLRRCSHARRAVRFHC